jgi:hypothetical protein
VDPPPAEKGLLAGVKRRRQQRKEARQREDAEAEAAESGDGALAWAKVQSAAQRGAERGMQDLAKTIQHVKIRGAAAKDVLNGDAARDALGGRSSSSGDGAAASLQDSIDEAEGLFDRTRQGVRKVGRLAFAACTHVFDALQAACLRLRSLPGMQGDSAAVLGSAVLRQSLQVPVAEGRSFSYVCWWSACSSARYQQAPLTR